MATILKPSYGASAALVTTNLQSIVSNGSIIAGWMSAVQDNTANLSDDELISYVIKLGTTPTVSTAVEIWAWSTLDDTPTYPDTITGTEGTVTLTSLNVKLSGAFKLCASFLVDATTNRIYSGIFSLAQAFGGTMPKKWGLFIGHNTGANLPGSGCVISRAAPTQYTNV